MAKHNDHSRKPAASEVSQTTKKADNRHKGFGWFMDQIHSMNMLHMIAGICQITLGVAVVVVSVLGLIKPLWLSLLFSILASVTTMVGIYFCYSTISRIDDNNLLRNAMRRIVEEQN